MTDKKEESEDNKREHADFQDQYRRSSNFSGLVDNEAEDLKIKGDGELALNEDEIDETDEEKIKDAMQELNLEEEE